MCSFPISKSMSVKNYDLISIGTGSAMSVVSRALKEKPDLSVAVIENEAPGGICLTRGCIPSKMLIYPAEVVENILKAKQFGIDTEIKDIDFTHIMNRMREHTRGESKKIERNLKKTHALDFYQETAEFVEDYTLKVGNKTIKGEKIVLGCGSRPFIPSIENLESVDYLTSKSILDLKELPKKVTIIGGGYIAAEYGYFLALMGAKVTIIGKNSRFVPSGEREVSEVLEKKLTRFMDIYTGYEVVKVEEKKGKKRVIAKSVTDDHQNKKLSGKTENILLAAGRRSNSDLLKPENSGIELNDKGWIKVDKTLETSKDHIWALGDATGKYMFKHVANHEAEVVYHNAFGEGVREVDHHAIPYAIYTNPQVASVGLKEREAALDHDILVGHYPFERTAKGSAMGIKDCFVKVIIEQGSYKILGAHIVGPHASVLIQEVVNLMYTGDGTAVPIYRGMHIHPSLSEVVERAFMNVHVHDHVHDHEH